jgi:xylose dehydrogenase (NAD/NADP)
MSRKVKWGIIGSASIAHRAVIPGIQQSELNEVYAIASRDEDKAQRAADQHGISKAYAGYESLLEDDAIDAVYIPLPNHLHKEWTIRAAEAGKHVLCEKPIALTSKEAEQMANACSNAGVLLSEAFMYRHHPRYQMIRDVISSGEIGKVRGIYSNFTFNNAENKSNVRYRREWGGGSLYDVGCYPINAARLLLGSEPEAVTVQALFSAEHDDVDMMAAGLIEFPDSVSLTFDCGMWAAFRNRLEVVGTDGLIEVPSAYISNMDGSSNFFVTTGGTRREVEVPVVNPYAVQADNFARAIQGSHTPSFSAADAINNMKVIDACLRSARDRARILMD